MAKKFTWTDPTNGKANHIEVLYTDGSGDPDTQYGGNVNMGVQELAVANEGTDLPSGRKFAARGVNTDTSPVTNGPLSNVYMVEGAISMTQEALDLSTGSRTTHAVSLPVAADAGNRLVAVVTHRSSSATLSTPAGWTKVLTSTATANQIAVYLKDDLGGQSISVDTGENSAAGSAWICEVAGLAASPLGATVANGSGTDSVTTLASGDIAVVAGDALILIAHTTSDDSTDHAYTNDLTPLLSGISEGDVGYSIQSNHRMKVVAPGTHSTTATWTTASRSAIASAVLYGA